MGWQVIFDKIEGFIDTFVCVAANCADEAQENAIEFLENGGFCPGNIMSIKRAD